MVVRVGEAGQGDQAVAGGRRRLDCGDARTLGAHHGAALLGFSRLCQQPVNAVFHACQYAAFTMRSALTGRKDRLNTSDAAGLRGRP